MKDRAAMLAVGRKTRNLRNRLGIAVLSLGIGAPLLVGCEELLDALAGSCPADPAESGGITWTPDVVHPVFYGYEDYTTQNGAPVPLRVWYPTYEGITDGAPILKMCVVRWPVVLFLHGQPPCPLADYNRTWTRLPAQLARNGYVVVVPNYAANLPSNTAEANVQMALNVLDWTRNGWEHAHWVDARPEATAVVGHSYGALLAAKVTEARPSIAAYAGLSGVWLEYGAPLTQLQSITVPSFFMWGNGDPTNYEDLDQPKLWDRLTTPRYAAVFPGFHFDYLGNVDSCSFERGTCPLIEAVAGDLVSLFLSRHVPLATSATRVPVSLEAPEVTLTFEQQFYVGGNLSGIAAIGSREGCSVDLRWADGDVTGSRHLGP